MCLLRVEAIYGYERPAIVRIYDFSGDRVGGRGHEAVTLADIGRLVVINADMKADDVPRLLAASADLARLALNPDADLVAGDPAESRGLYDPDGGAVASLHQPAQHQDDEGVEAART